jgi:cytochrome c-type biogenesis protein CcmH
VRRLAALILAAAMLLAPASALGLTVTEVAEELRCPTCNAPLEVSNAPVAQRMKAEIAERIAQGRTKDEIKAEFVQEFGRGVLTTPPTKGFDLVAWIVPILAVAIGLCSIPFITRAWAKRRPRTEAAPVALSSEDRARIERELDAFGDG